MHLHIKKISKIVKPSSLVDKTFNAQGFKKVVKKDLSYYHLLIKDNITDTTYELRIPFQIIYPNHKESVYKIQDIVLYAKSPLLKNLNIPNSIINAAYEKIHDVFSYLSSISKKEVYY